MAAGTLKDFSMFVLRLILGMIFIAHGAQKLFGMFGGIGIEGTTKMMEGLGFYDPHALALIWSGIEFTGGVFLVLGVLARYAAVSITVIMLVSIWKINLAYGFFIQNGGYEYNLLIIAACVPLICLGGGTWSVWDM
ncbi:MAG: DoxX family protein [Candidatus Omnitrophica bacterium]|nr:DoxX family protein [Candidatus Omnitrophota bacterium]